MGKNNSNINNRSINSYIKLAKKLEEEGKDVTMEVKNKNTKLYGVASVTPNNKIAVWEGRDDGKDDAIYNIEEFKENYEILKLINEYDEEYEEEFE